MEATTEITFVTGKGGVGKSLMAASLAYLSASQGHKTLLVELGEVSFYEKFFQIGSNSEPKTLQTNLDCVKLSSSQCLQKYIAHFVKVKKIVDLFFNTKPMRSLVKAAPALKELALLGQITSHVRRHGPELIYDRVIIDSYATGHFLALLRAPYGMYEAVKLGPMGDQCKSLQKVLEDPNVTSIKIITLPEQAPSVETLELAEQLKNEFTIQSEIISNQNLEIEEHLCSDDEFSQYLRQKLIKQKASEKRLTSSPFKFNKLPFIYELNNRKLVEKMALKIQEGP